MYIINTKKKETTKSNRELIVFVFMQYTKKWSNHLINTYYNKTTSKYLPDQSINQHTKQINKQLINQKQTNQTHNSQLITQSRNLSTNQHNNWSSMQASQQANKQVGGQVINQLVYQHWTNWPTYEPPHPSPTHQATKP